MDWHHTFSLILMAVLFMFLAAPVQAQSDVDDADNATEPAAFTVLQSTNERLLVQLPNRMIVLVQELHTAPVVSAQIWVKTGSIFEQEHIGAGLSHFLEHLVASGSTSNRTEAQSQQVLGKIGAQTNAATGLDTVRYFINTTSPYTHEAIDLLSDWLFNSLITPEEYARERDVIQREFEHGQGDPSRIYWRLTQQARYRAHPTRHPTIGYLDEFLSVTRDEIYDFYKRMYVPNNMVFVVVGDVDRHKVVQQIAQLCGNIEPGKLPELSFPVEPEIDSPREMTGHADVNRPRLRLAWPGTRISAEHDYALDLLSRVLGDGESSRLTRQIRDEARAVTGIGAYNLSFAWGEGFFAVDAMIEIDQRLMDNVRASKARLASISDQTSEQEKAAVEVELAQASAALNAAIKTASDHVRGLILDEVNKIKTDGVTHEELARAKRQTLAGEVYSGQTAHALAERLARDTIGMADPDYFKQYVTAIEPLTTEDLRSAANAVLLDSRLITVTLVPLQPGESPTGLVRDLEEMDVSGLPREVVELDNRAILDKLTVRSVQDRVQEIQTEPVVRHVLPNGLRVLIGRSTLVPAVSMQLYQIGGLLADEPGREGIANAAATMMVKGTTTRTAQQIAQAVEELGAGLSSDAGNNTIFVQAQCLTDDLPVVLELFADVTLNANFPEDEWDKMRPRLISAIESQGDTWGGELRRAFRQAYFGNHPWSQSTLGRREVVAAITADDIRTFHRKQLSASQSVLAIFGDVDPNQVIDQVEKLFANMPVGETISLPQPTPPQPVVLQVKTSKPLAAVQIGLGPTPVVTSDDHVTLRVLSRVMSDFPSGWLEQELRGRGPGLVYAVGAGQMAGLVPGYFAVLFNTTPSKVEQAMQRANGVIDRAINELISEDDLARAKAGVLADEFMGKQSNSQRAMDAAINELYGLGTDFSHRFMQQVQELTSEDLRAAAGRYLMRGPVIIVLTNEPASQEALEATVIQTK